MANKGFFAKEGNMILNQTNLFFYYVWDNNGG